MAPNELRGRFRRHVLAHTVVWVLFALILTALTLSKGRWAWLWINVPLIFVPLLYLAPDFYKVRKAAKSLNYTRGRTLTEYLQGIPSSALLREFNAQQARANAWRELLRETRATDPNLLKRIRQLQEADNLDGAKAVLTNVQKEQRRRRREEDRMTSMLRRQADALGCGHLVEPMLAAKDFTAADRVIGMVRGLLERGRILGVREEVSRLVFELKEPGFGDVEDFLRQVRDERSATSLLDGLARQISALPPQNHRELNALLDELREKPPSSREFRKLQHDLEQGIAKAGGER